MTKTEVEAIIKSRKSFSIITGDSIKQISASDTVTFFDKYMTIYHGWFDETILYSEILHIRKGLLYSQYGVTFGSDPELFFMKDNVMIPSTTVLTKDTALVTRDGFQVELHPKQSHCRQLAANGIRDCLIEAEQITNRTGTKLSFNLAYTVDSKVWKGTELSVKRFGCNPTLNVYEENQKRSTGLRERFRAGGGHIHIGGITAKAKNDLPTLVKLFDIICGNTLVLLDRDERNIIRRKNYGRAGEYRAKSYGVEYRVPSNFWLRHYILFSLTNGLLRNAVTYYEDGLAENIIDRFNMEDVRKAINENNFELAMKNFLIFVEFLKERHIPLRNGITFENHVKFLTWINKGDPLKKIGNDTDEKILEHWTNLRGTSAIGFESFIEKIK